MRVRPGRRDRSRGALMAVPSSVGVVVFTLMPLAVVIWLATQQWDLLGSPRFTGLANAGSVLTDPAFWNALQATGILIALVIPVQTALAFATALLLAGRGVAKPAFRAVLVLPWVAAPLAVGMVWAWIWAPDGGLVSLLFGRTVNWIADPVGAMLILAVAIVWNHVGYLSLFFTAGLAAIPSQVREAAMIDGADAVQRARFITIPLLRPTLVFVLITSIAEVASLFDQVYGLTGGGPGRATEVLALRIFSDAFTTFDLGDAAAATVILMVILLPVMLFIRRPLDRGVRRA